jgi:hypothetical protein
MADNDEVSGTPHVEFKLDDKKLKAIRECLRKGTLKISLENATVSITHRGALLDGYLWD